MKDKIIITGLEISVDSFRQLKEQANSIKNQLDNLKAKFRNIAKRHSSLNAVIELMGGTEKSVKVSMPNLAVPKSRLELDPVRFAAVTENVEIKETDLEIQERYTITDPEKISQLDALYNPNGDYGQVAQGVVKARSIRLSKEACERIHAINPHALEKVLEAPTVR